MFNEGANKEYFHKRILEQLQQTENLFEELHSRG